MGKGNPGAEARILRRLSDVLIVLTAAGLLISCGQSDSASAGSAKATITPSQAMIKPLGRQRFSVAAQDAQGNPVSNAALQWISTDPAVASVDATGLAIGQSEGTAAIQVGVSQTGSGGQVSTLTLAVAPLRVTQNAARPVEIINLVPIEDQVVTFASRCKGACPVPYEIIISGVLVNFLFSNGDLAESARLVFNSTDVTGSAYLISQKPAPYLSGEGQFYYLWSQFPAAGTSNVTVELRSKQGKLVSYSWSFTVL